MANQPYDRTVINPRERPLSVDINQLQSQLDRAQREALQRVLSGRVSDADATGSIRTGFFGDGFQVIPFGGLNVAVQRGLGYIAASLDLPSAVGGILGLDDLAIYKPLVMPSPSPAVFAVPAGPIAPNARIDLIEVIYKRRTENPLSRDVLDIVTGVFNPTSVQKTLSFELGSQTGIAAGPGLSTAGVSYVVGTPGNPPVAPAGTPGYVPIARIFVPTGAVAVSALNMDDRRALLFPFSAGRASCRVTAPASGALAPPTLNNVVAAPSVRLCAVMRSTTAARFDLHLIAGGNVAIPRVRAVAIDRLNANPPGTSFDIPWVGLATTVTVDSTLQADLNGANASPATPVAIGSVIVQIPMGGQHQAAGVTSTTLQDPFAMDISLDWESF